MEVREMEEAPLVGGRVDFPLIPPGYSLSRTPSVEELLRYDTDTIIRTRGIRQTYQIMMRDPHVRAGLVGQTAKATENGVRFIESALDPDATEHVSFLNYLWRNTKMGMRSMRAAGLGMMKDGRYSLAKESIRYHDGDWAGAIGCDYLAHMDSADFRPVTDRARKVTNIAHFWNGKVQKIYPREHFVFGTFLPQYESPSGLSALHSAFDAWRGKAEAWRMWLVWMGRLSSGNIMGKYPSNKPSYQDWLLDHLRSWSTKTVLMIPDDVEVEIVESTSDGEAFRKAMSYFAREILISIALSHLGIEEGELQGAKAAGQVHEGRDDLASRLVRHHLEETFQMDFAEYYLHLNYTRIMEPPKMSLQGTREPTVEDTQKQKTRQEILEKAARTEPVSRRQYREELNLWDVQEGEQLLEPPEPMMMPGSDPFMQIPGLNGQDPAKPPGPDDTKERKSAAFADKGMASVAEYTRRILADRLVSLSLVEASTHPEFIKNIQGQYLPKLEEDVRGKSPAPVV